MIYNEYLQRFSIEIDRSILYAYAIVFRNEYLFEEEIDNIRFEFKELKEKYDRNEFVLEDNRKYVISGNLSPLDFLFLNVVNNTENSFYYFIQKSLVRKILETVIIEKAILNMNNEKEIAHRDAKVEYFKIDSYDQDNVSTYIDTVKDTIIKFGFDKMNINIKGKNIEFSHRKFIEDINVQFNDKNFLLNDFPFMYKQYYLKNFECDNNDEVLPELFSDYIIFIESWIRDLQKNHFIFADEYIKDAKFNFDLNYKSIFDKATSYDEKVELLKKYDAVHHFPEVKDFTLNENEKLEKLNEWCPKIKTRMKKNIDRNYERIIREYNRIVTIQNNLAEKEEKVQDIKLWAINHILFDSLLHNSFFCSIGNGSFYFELLKELDLNKLYNSKYDQYWDKYFCNEQLMDIHFFKTCMQFNIDMNKLASTELYFQNDFFKYSFDNQDILIRNAESHDFRFVKKLMSFVSIILGRFYKNDIFDIINKMVFDKNIALETLCKEYLKIIREENQEDDSLYPKLNSLSKIEFSKPKEKQNYQFIFAYLIHCMYTNKSFFENFVFEESKDEDNI